MDNKLVKRIVALASSAVMLGSCAFATSLNSASYTDGSLTFNYNADGADKVTYIAYAAKTTDGETFDWKAADGTKYVFCEIEGNDVIVALDQIDNIASDAGATEKVQAVDATKIPEDATAIVIKSGDSKGTAAAGIAAPLTVAPAGPTVTFMNGGTEAYATAVAANGTVELPTVPTLEPEEDYAVTEFEFVGWVTEDGEDFANANITEDVTVYAKYDTGLVYGDIDGADGIDEYDLSVISFFVDYEIEDEFVNAELYPGLGIVGGDIDNADGVDEYDLSVVSFYVDYEIEDELIGQSIFYIAK